MSKTAKKKSGVNSTSTALLFVLLAGFVVLFIPVFHLPATMDEAMQPRLLASGVFALIFTAVLLRPTVYKYLNIRILQNKVFIAFILYFCLSLISLFFARNPIQGFFDLSKTGMTLVFMALAAMVLASSTEWIAKLSKMAVAAAGIALAIGMGQYFLYVIMATTPKLPDGLELIYAVKGLMFHKNEYTASLMLLMPWVAYAAF
jgi:hypothetical protein